MNPKQLDLKLEQIANMLPYQVFNCTYIFLITIAFLAFVFTGLQIEEWILGCNGMTTFLQFTGFDMEFADRCDNQEWITNSLIFVVGSFCYGWSLLWFANSIRKYYMKRINNGSES